MSKELTLDALIASLDEPLEKVAKEEVKPVEGPTTSAKDQLQSLLAKQASENSTTEDTTDMSKQATQLGREIAGSILGLLKQAEEGSNMVIDQTEELVAQQDDATERTPREGKTVTETLKAIVERGSQEGAVHPDKLALNAVDGDETDADIDLEDSDGNDVEGEDTSDLNKEAFEKAAAVFALVREGNSFEDAVTLVKQAEEALLADEEEHVKLASINALIAEGMDIESAVALTKQAMEILAKGEAEEATLNKQASIVALMDAGFSAEEAVALVG